MSIRPKALCQLRYSKGQHWYFPGYKLLRLLYFVNQIEYESYDTIGLHCLHTSGTIDIPYLLMLYRYYITKILSMYNVLFDPIVYSTNDTIVGILIL